MIYIILISIMFLLFVSSCQIDNNTSDIPTVPDLPADSDKNNDNKAPTTIPQPPALPED